MQAPAPSPSPSPSVPPPSYPPPSGAPDRHATHHGWRPADEDDSPEAVAWRARTGLRRADRALTAFSALNANVEKLNGTIETWSETWGRHWATLGKIAWAVGLPLLAAAAVGAGALAWRWVSTLHH